MAEIASYKWQEASTSECPIDLTGADLQLLLSSTLKFKNASKCSSFFQPCNDFSYSSVFLGQVRTNKQRDWCWQHCTSST